MTLASDPEPEEVPRHQTRKIEDEFWQAGVSDGMRVSTAQKKVLDARWIDYELGKLKRISLIELKRRASRG